MPSGGLPKEPLHKIPVSPVQPTLPLEDLDLQFQWEVSANAVDCQGGEYILNSPSSLLLSAGGGSWGPP